MSNKFYNYVSKKPCNSSPQFLQRFKYQNQENLQNLINMENEEKGLKI